MFVLSTRCTAIRGTVRSSDGEVWGGTVSPGRMCSGAGGSYVLVGDDFG